MSFKSLTLCFALSLTGLNTWAAGNFVSLSGDVRVESNSTATVASAAQSVEAGTTVHTGTNGNAVLRLDDGQQVALSPNTSFKIDQFRFDNARPDLNNVTMSLFKGALRILTGLIGQRDHSKFALRTATSTIGIRGTDFMVAMTTPSATVNPTYMQVIQGGISAANTAGVTSFVAGTTGTIASATTLPATITASTLPTSIATTFSNLGSLALSSVGASGGSGAASASSTSVGGVSAAGITIGVVAATALITAAQANPTTGTTGTTAAEAQ